MNVHCQYVLPLTRALVSSLTITSLPCMVAAICSATAANGLPMRSSVLEIAPWGDGQAERAIAQLILVRRPVAWPFHGRCSAAEKLDDVSVRPINGTNACRPPPANPPVNNSPVTAQ
jgi:hypothetical protein